VLKLLPRTLALAVVGGLTAALFVGLAYRSHPDLAWEMDRDQPAVTSGFYPVERHGDETFAWTSPQATLVLRALDRRVPWHCTIRLRGARPSSIEQPAVQVAMDGVTLFSRTATNSYEDFSVEAPVRQTGSGLTLTITSAPIFVPSPSDTRELGVQIDRLGCRPGGAGLPLLPRAPMLAAMAAGGFFGAMFGLVGLSFSWGLAGVLMLGAAQAVPMSTGTALYSDYTSIVIRLAIWIVLPAVFGAAVLDRVKQRPLTTTARVAVAVSACVLFLKLLALLHPSKLLVDAVFHGHRLDWVLGGRYYFTQPLPDGVSFPYAIGLYVFAAPWSVLTEDHVALLWIVVSVSNALAGLALYPMITRFRSDGRTGVLAVILYHCLPLPFIVIGNANLTFVFGAAVALVAVADATILPFPTHPVTQVVVLFVVVSLAFLSHVGVFPLLLTTLVLIAFLYRWLGGLALASASRAVLLATTLALVCSVVSYYGHFSEVFRTFDRVRARAAATSPAADLPSGAAGKEVVPSPQGSKTFGARAASALTLGARAIGWPMVFLAFVGAWRLQREGARDRLWLVLAASLGAYLVFVAFSVATPVEPRFQRYTDEFIDRVNYLTAPVAVILAARAVSWAWDAGWVQRAAAALLMLAAGVSAARAWLGWIA
jgi:hypothetical protein